MKSRVSTLMAVHIQLQLPVVLQQVTQAVSVVHGNRKVEDGVSGHGGRCKPGSSVRQAALHTASLDGAKAPIVCPVVAAIDLAAGKPSRTSDPLDLLVYKEACHVGLPVCDRHVEGVIALTGHAQSYLRNTLGE